MTGHLLNSTCIPQSPDQDAARRMDRGSPDRILRRPEVEALVGVKRSTLYDWMARGTFPKPVALGVRLVGWRESDVIAWLDARAPRVGDAA